MKNVLLAVAMLCRLCPDAFASPNVSFDHPVYEVLAQREALGEIPPFESGLLPLSSDRIATILDPSGRSLRHHTRFWAAPLVRALTAFESYRDRLRPYSTPVRPRNVAGSVAISCERNEGRPCGDGHAAMVEVESAAGIGDLVSADIRLLGEVGTDDRPNELELDRAYVSGAYGLIAAEVGRDVVVLGPRSRTQLGWGLQAAPTDHIRVSSAHPWRVTRALRIDGQYILARLRAPQAKPGNLASIVRGQIGVSDRLDIGVFQMLQLEGEGAPHLGVGDFILEHVRRGDISATQTDTSNRRFGFDLVGRFRELSGLRLYYQLAFEDIRKARWMDAVRYDADHLLGLDLAALGSGHRHRLQIELATTGVRSQEHGPRSTGFTNAGRIVGDPLGPDTTSLYIGGAVSLPVLTLYPWLELATAHSDVYQFMEYGPINGVSRGIDERRARFGMRARRAIRRDTWIEGLLVYERVTNFAFEEGSARYDVGGSLRFVWYPDSGPGTLRSPR